MKTDREQLQELMAAYANFIDTKQYSSLTDCFTPDATAIYAGFGSTLEGAKAIEQHMRKCLDPLDATQHLFANFVIDIDGDTARISAGVIAQHLLRGAPGGETYMAGNTYKVRARKIEGTWKIDEVSLPPTIWSQGNRDILPKAN